MQHPLGLGLGAILKLHLEITFGGRSTSVIPGLTRNPVPLGAGFLDSRFRGNDNPDLC